jgi:alpha-ketoglutarate-dependent taurine dioxygenase
LGIPIKAVGRGHPMNQGEDLRAVHPVVRTNPVTGWKGLFVNYAFTKRFNDVTRDENEWVQTGPGWVLKTFPHKYVLVDWRDHSLALYSFLMKYCHDLLALNHDLQVRFRWTKNAVAIWDNRSTYHTATYDYDAKRAGDRVCSVGEKPYFDPKSVSRKQALKAEGKTW